MYSQFTKIDEWLQVNSLKYKCWVFFGYLISQSLFYLGKHDSTWNWSRYSLCHHPLAVITWACGRGVTSSRFSTLGVVIKSRSARGFSWWLRQSWTSTGGQGGPRGFRVQQHHWPVRCPMVALQGPVSWTDGFSEGSLLYLVLLFLPKPWSMSNPTSFQLIPLLFKLTIFVVCSQKREDNKKEKGIWNIPIFRFS